MKPDADNVDSLGPNVSRCNKAVGARLTDWSPLFRRYWARYRRISSGVRHFNSWPFRGSSKRIDRRQYWQYISCRRPKRRRNKDLEGDFLKFFWSGREFYRKGRGQYRQRYPNANRLNKSIKGIPKPKPNPSANGKQLTDVIVVTEEEEEDSLTKDQ